MPESVVRGESAIEFFREQIGKAMQHQRVSTSAFTEYYLVNLLAAFMRGESLPGREAGFDETPLALLYVRALDASPPQRARRLRATGDTALFVSGFFADSLADTVADVRYYAILGGRAYAHLSREHEGPRHLGPGVFAELAARFREFVDVLAEVSEQSRVSTPASLVRLYERWVQTGSRRAAALLAEQGINPVAPGEDQLH
jgi:hypothetical protein